MALIKPCVIHRLSQTCWSRWFLLCRGCRVHAKDLREDSYHIHRRKDGTISYDIDGVVFPFIRLPGRYRCSIQLVECVHYPPPSSGLFHAQKVGELCRRFGSHTYPAFGQLERFCRSLWHIHQALVNFGWQSTISMVLGRSREGFLGNLHRTDLKETSFNSTKSLYKVIVMSDSHDWDLYRSIQVFIENTFANRWGAERSFVHSNIVAKRILVTYSSSAKSTQIRLKLPLQRLRKYLWCASVDNGVNSSVHFGGAINHAFKRLVLIRH